MIFVSYSWKDRPDVEILCRRLRAERAEYWLDSERLDITRPLDPQIEAALTAATAIIFVDTPASRVSIWVARERSLAGRLAKRMLVADIPTLHGAGLAERWPSPME
ncbi:MAG: hypothetical protein QOH12_1111 [Solirubrobacteraceae bacterium]|jgi:hypothetical protein|nr:hypothetical protein [Solirubrobacteraceae bacterium]